MEPQPPGNTHPSKVLLFPGVSSCQDHDAMEIASPSASSWSPNSQQKRKWCEVSFPDPFLIDGQVQPGVALSSEGITNDKNKQPMGLTKDFQTETVTSLDSYFDVAAGSNTYNLNAEKDFALSFQKDVEVDAMDYEYPYDYDENDEYEDDDNEDYDYSNIEFDNYYNLAAKFDDMDLPPGVEATVPWLQNVTSEKIERKEALSVFEIAERYKQFKQFDTVKDYSDHHFAKKGAEGTSSTKKPSKDWVKRIQHDWKLLEKDLPSSIIVRVYEERMDLLRAVITGPAGTPYHDGLFFFDAFFPPTYPSSPPLVYYHSGGLRLNPNLYNCGKVCLSLLGTWSGKGCERWNPDNSSMLQVLVSIQALVLNEKPYFNEPGYADLAGTANGERKSMAYNEEAFLLSCKTMIYSLRKPPKHFEDFVAGHFRERGRTILIACLSYLKGCQVGCKLEIEVPDVDLDDSSILNSTYKCALRSLYEDLLMEFTVKGADCDAFLAKKVKKAGSAKTRDS